MKPSTQAAQNDSGMAICVTDSERRHTHTAQNAKGQVGHRYQMKCLASHPSSLKLMRPKMSAWVCAQRLK